MGLFSGSFGTGLVTGLASSVDKSLKDALDKRDQEMSSARKFWQTRQAQKLDLKESTDARAEKALNRLITEAGGDVGLGFAAYQAAGGDVDSVEAFLTKFDATKDAKGTFKLSDALTLPEGFDSSTINLSRDQAFAGVRTELKGIDANLISVDDPLSNIGLGIKGGAANKVADKINGLITPEAVQRVEGFEGVNIDTSKMLAAEKYAQDQKKFDKAMGANNYREKLFNLGNELDALKPEDFENQELYQNARNKIITKRDGVLSDINDIAAAENAAGNTGVSDSIMRVVWTDTREQGRKMAGITGKGEQAMFNFNGVMTLASAKPKEYAAAVNKADANSASLFVKTIADSDGNFTTSGMNIISTDASLKSAYNSITGETTAATTGESTVEPEASPAQSYSTAEGIAADTQGFASFVTGNIKDLDAAIDAALGDKPSGPLKLLHDDLIAAGKSEQEANGIITDVVIAERNKRTEIASKPSGFKLGDKLRPVKTLTTTPIGEDGNKTAGDVSWSPTSAPSMFGKLKDKSIPENVRMEILEDYVALMVEQGNESQAERARAAAGFGTE